jgi:hypothetical protein
MYVPLHLSHSADRCRGLHAVSAVTFQSDESVSDSSVNKVNTKLDYSGSVTIRGRFATALGLT